MPSSAVPAMQGLSIEAVEWLPSGAESDLVRVRGRWATESGDAARELPSLMVRAEGRDHRFDSLPDARFGRDPLSWRGSYLVPSELVASDPEGLWVEWVDGARAGLPALTRGIEPPPGVAPERPLPPPGGAQVIDRAVLAERRARKAEAAEAAQARVAAEALRAVEALELRSTELERRLDEATAERDALAAAARDGGERTEREREALSAALASAAELREQAGAWQRQLRAAESARTDAAARLTVLEAEQMAVAADRERLNRAEAAAAAATAELSRARAAAVADLESARAAWELRRGELESALAAARAELAAARDEAVRTESVARAALENELDRERAAGEPLAADLQAALGARQAAEAALAQLRGELAAAATARETASAALSTAEMALDDAVTELARLRGELEAERAARTAAEAALAAATADAERAGATLQDRIAELERHAKPEPDRLERLAREQAEAAAGRESAGPTDLAARLDAAAAALRAREAEPESPAPPAHDSPRPTVSIVAPAGPPPRADHVGSSQRDYPLLRGALVKLAHDDAVAAGRLLAGLLPAQGAILAEPLAYDLTIRELGTFAIDIADGSATAAPVAAPRRRREAAFHLTADALTFAEALAGVDHRVGRWRGSIRVRGRRKRHRPLLALVQTDLGLTAAARAGASLEPGLAWQALAYAVHPSWTSGLVFTVASTVDDETWHLTARDGGGLAATSARGEGSSARGEGSSGEPDAPPTASVTMSRAAFDRLLRQEPHPRGDRPAIRGDREAVAALLALITRARG